MISVAVLVVRRSFHNDIEIVSGEELTAYQVVTTKYIEITIISNCCCIIGHSCGQNGIVIIILWEIISRSLIIKWCNELTSLQSQIEALCPHQTDTQVCPAGRKSKRPCEFSSLMPVATSSPKAHGQPWGLPGWQ
jgi:hypothetical protein